MLPEGFVGVSRADVVRVCPSGGVGVVLRGGAVGPGVVSPLSPGSPDRSSFSLPGYESGQARERGCGALGDPAPLSLERKQLVKGHESDALPLIFVGSHAEARRARSRMDVERARWWFARMRAVIDGREGAQ